MVAPMEEDERPIWRTGLAAALAAWMALVLAALLSVWRLGEVLSFESLLGLGVALFVVAPIALLLLSLLAMLRYPATGWMAPAALLFFAGAMVPAFRPITQQALRLNFAAHRPAYDAIVADAKAGRIAVKPNGGGWIVGERDGVRFRYRADRPGRIEFGWTRGQMFEQGVRYDDAPCRPTPAVRCVDQGEPLDGPYSYYGWAS